jgi:hypothetical protein
MSALKIPVDEEYAKHCPHNEKLWALILTHAPNITDLAICVHYLKKLQKHPWLEVIRRAVSPNSCGMVHGFLHLKSIELYIP